MRKLAIIWIGYFATVGALFAQPANDECTSPIVLTQVFNSCSPNAAYTNVGATPSSYGPATCFGAVQRDVWFTFTAQATDVTITVRGATPQAPGGTLQRPQIAIYSGVCGGTINQLECQSAPPGVNIVEGYQGGLFVGNTYLVRVQGFNGNVGTFQLCINNYNPPAVPTSDCPTAAILCDKSPFVVQSVTGAGNDITELNDATCFFNGSPSNFESNSTWFVWTCSKAGTLTFTLTPLNITDDLDFVVYRLPNGLGNCSGKVVERCMASGDFNYPSPCMGPTGLRNGETDISENAGCGGNKNNFLAPLQMQAGVTYALVINNFTSTGNGFSIEFGGTGEFLGPEAEFIAMPDVICQGASVVINDASTFALGSITGWQWTFGAQAVPPIATGPGPHTVMFNEEGLRPIALTVQTNLGCKVTEVKTIQVNPQVEVDKVIAAPDCNGTANGSVTIANITKGKPPFQFSWNGGPFTNNPTLDGLGPGVYSVVIRDAFNCTTTISIPVNERILEAEPFVAPPLCFGDANGSITLQITNGKPPIQFDWGSGLTNSNVLNNLPAGTYTVSAIDDALCKGSFTITVTDHPPVSASLQPENISCNGANDGRITAQGEGGVQGFSFQWSNNATANPNTGLPPGDYTVTVSDANGCTATASASVTEPPRLRIGLVEALDLICNGLPTGVISLTASGGTPEYQFSPDGVRFFSSPELSELLAGAYNVKVRDANGCLDSLTVSLNQPPPLVVSAQPEYSELDLGFTVDIGTFVSPIGRQVTFSWLNELGLSCANCPNPTLTAIESGAYPVLITDEDGCTATDTIRLKVNKIRPVYIPNVFSPVKLYPNDGFTAFAGPGVQRIELLRIFDRWGSMVYEAQNIPPNDPNLGWDGTYKGKKIEGVFAYYILVRFLDQVSEAFSGDVTVIR